MDIKIEEAKPTDAYSIKEVLYFSWLATYPNEKEGVTLDDIKELLKDALSEEKVRQKAEQIMNAPDKKNLVARLGAKVVGFCLAERSLEKNQLRAIYVLPEYTNKGIGRMLWCEIKPFFDNSKKITVELATYNENAMNFYKKLGFKDSGKRITNEKLRLKSGTVISELEMEILPQ